MESDNNVLQVQNLYKKFRDFEIKRVSFSLESGYIMGFIGRNGSGKTTVMKLIQNVIVKNSGTVKVCGYDNVRQEIKAKNEIGFVVDGCPFIKHYTLMENAGLFGRYYVDFDEGIFHTYLKRFDLDGNSRVSSLSKGMQSRFQLAFALAHKPRLLIMDEPTDGLDPIFRREFLSLMQELIADERMGILLSTHNTSDLDKIADYITLIDKGEIILSKEKDLLLQEHSIIKGSRELLIRIPEDRLIAVRRYPEGFEAMAKNIEDIKSLYHASENVVIQRALLDDIMYYYSKRGRNDGKIQGGKIQD